MHVESAANSLAGTALEIIRLHIKPDCSALFHCLFEVSDSTKEANDVPPNLISGIASAIHGKVSDHVSSIFQKSATISQRPLWEKFQTKFSLLSLLVDLTTSCDAAQKTCLHRRLIDNMRFAGSLTIFDLICQNSDTLLFSYIYHNLIEEMLLNLLPYLSFELLIGNCHFFQETPKIMFFWWHVMTIPLPGDRSQ
jgi:hypothetical protein